MTSLLSSSPLDAQLATQGFPMQSASKAAPQSSKEAAKDFEAVFLSEMFSHMFEGLDVDPMFGGGQGEKMFRGMLVQQYGKIMAQGKGIGIADQLQKMMIQMQAKKG